MLCFTVWECAVTPVGGCGKNVCLAKLGSGKWYEGSWMSSDWKKQLLQEMVLVFCCQSQESQRMCDGFEDYIILYIDIVIVLLGANLLEVFKSIMFHICFAESIFPIVHKDWRCSFCECAHSATSLLDQSEKGPGPGTNTWGDFSLRVWKFAGSFKRWQWNRSGICRLVEVHTVYVYIYIYILPESLQ